MDDKVFRISSVVLMSLFMALLYQVAWQYPMIDGLPLAERMLDAGFLSKDFYTNALVDYSPRKHIIEVIVAASKLLDADYTLVIAWANVIRIFLFGIVLYGIYRELAQDAKTAFVAFYLSAISFLAVPTLMAWWPVSYDLTASNLAGLFAFTSWWLVLRNKVSIAILLLAVSVYFHPLVGVHAAIIATILFLVRFGLRGLISHLWDAFNYIAFAVFIGAFMLSYLNYESSLPTEEFHTINVLFRHAHHFLFAEIEPIKIIALLLYLAGFTFCYLRARQLKGREDYFQPFILYFVAMLCINYFFVELIPTRIASSFIPLRAFPILPLILVLYYARYMMILFRQKDYFNFLVMHLPFLPYAKVGLTWFIFPNAHEVLLPLLVFVLVCSWLVISHYSEIKFGVFNEFADKVFGTMSLEKLTLPIFSILVLGGLYSFEFEIPKLESEAAIYTWLNKNTHEDDVVIAELNAANNQYIRLVARRAVVISKDFPFVEKHYREWYERYQAVYKSKKQARGNVDAMDAEALDQLADKYESRWLLRTKPLQANGYFKEVARVEGERSTAIVYENKQF